MAVSVLKTYKILPSWRGLRRLSTSHTVDKKDVNHHSKLSKIWWDQKDQLKPLHSFNPLRVQFVRDGLANVNKLDSKAEAHSLKGVSILDVGCGGGILSEALARVGANVVGIDPSNELISIAQNHASLDKDLTDRLKYLNTTIEDHKPDDNYDAIVASEVLEHVSNPQLFLKACVDILKPGGSIFITTINRTLPSWVGGIVLAEYLLKIVPLGTHEWNKFISPEETQRLLDKCGCQTKLIHGIIYNPLTNSWSWINSTAIHYGLHAVKI